MTVGTDHPGERQHRAGPPSGPSTDHPPRPAEEVSTWQVRQESYDPAALPALESVFALANGHLGVRGVLDEGGASGNPSTYLNSCFEECELRYPESGYAFPERNEVLVGAPEGTLCRLFVDGCPVDPPPDRTHRHERLLDLRAGTLDRSFDWSAPSGGAVRIHSTRLVSFGHPAVLAIRYEVTALDRPVRIRLHSDLRANAALPPRDVDDPRAPTLLDRPLVPEWHHAVAGSGGLLAHRTRHSGQRIVAAVSHLLDEAPSGAGIAVDAGPDLVRAVVEARLAPGDRLAVTKLVGYAWSGHRPPPGEPATDAATTRDEPDTTRDELIAAAEAALGAAARRGWSGLHADQRAYLDGFWDGADVRLDGDPQLQQAVRFALFHLLQATARTGDRPVPAKGLTGNGYNGHAMWDAETFVLPVLTYLRPEAAAGPLRWLHATLGRARDRARELRLAGAAFPWRTISGRECSGYWPAGSAALHVNADIAVAVLRYVAATGDLDLLRDTGLEILVETARLWCRVGHFDGSGGFHIDGITGPDEYTALGNDNLFTNVMARRNLLGAVAAARRLPEPARRLGVDEAELAAWQRAADAMHLPYDAARGVHQQYAGFTDLQEWDFAGTRPDEYPLLLHYPYLELYRRQVVKQADVVLAMQHCGDLFSTEQKARNFAYYERRTVRDSSLSASAQVVLAAELGHLELAYAHLAESALQDLHEPGTRTRDGLHVAALAGVWTALVAGFGGLRDHGGELAFAPRLPRALTRLEFSIVWRGCRLRVTVTPREATYLLRDGGEDLRLRHHGTPIVLSPGRPCSRPVPRLGDPGPEPPAPPGRAPRRRVPRQPRPVVPDRPDGAPPG